MKMLSALIFCPYESPKLGAQPDRSAVSSGGLGDAHQQAAFAFATDTHCLPLRKRKCVRGMLYCCCSTVLL